MKVARRSLSLLMVMLLLSSCLLLSGCHGSRERTAFAVPESFDTSRQYEITFWAKNDNNRVQAAIYTKALADFHELYPNITVNMRSYTDYSRIYNDVITNIATNTTPNVCITYPDHIATYMTGQDVVVPLDALFGDARYGFGGSELRYDGPKQDEVIRAFLDECTIGGIHYAIPFMRSTEACYVNKTFVEKLGYTLPEVLTWDFVWEVSEAAMARDADGNFLLAVEESIYAAKPRTAYPAYADALADVTADWEGFLAKIPPVDPPLQNARLEAAWCLWSYLLNPSGYVKRPHIMMAASSIASAWQMNHNAAALRDDLPLAIDLVSNMFDGIGALGQLPDMVDDGRCMAQAIHPPTQGWALLWIAQKHDLAKELPREKLEFLYDGFRRWASWFFLARDDDRDGLPQYDNGDEIGFDDCSPFQFHTTLVTPDLSAYLVLLYDGLALMAEALGMPEKAKDWTRRGDELTQRMLDTLWNGERFVAVTNGSHEVVATDSVVYYLPLVLGKRLPQDVIDKMTADLMVEGDFLTPFGLCVEKLESEFFRLSGMSRGWVLPASNLLIATGMYNAGKVTEAKTIARRYCDACAKWGISMLLDPIRGTPNGFACSWSANTFLVLADLACNL